jgi:hypothetical protein
VQCFRKDKILGTLWRVVGRRAVKIRSEHAGLTALDVDEGRVVVGRSDGPLEVVGADGSLLQSIRLRPGEVGAAALAGKQLVVETGSTLRVYGIGDGKLARTRRLLPGARLQNAQEGVAVYLAGRTIHLLRLSDGRDAIVRPPGQGPVQAKIGSAGIFYSYVVRGSRRPGRVAFASLQSLSRRFR